MTKELKGGCHCGAVSYSLSAEPMWVGHCQCTNCQTFSGTGHATNLVVPNEAFTVEGEMSHYDYDADSGNHMTRHFCATCGTQIYGQSSGAPAIVVIRVGSLEDPAKVTPGMVIYTDSSLDWDSMDHDLKSLPGMITR